MSINEAMRLERIADYANCKEAEASDLRDELIAVKEEITSVLSLMDGLAEQWGDEAVFRRCRDRLRALVSA